jgi:Pyruvate/2-oxoacid:ferredoxin oxidoreductase delta subunit
VKILCFSATGNSLYVARRIGGEILPVARLQKEGVYEIADAEVGIVCPVYGFTAPYFLREYLAKTVIKAEYVFVVMTFGNISMNALDSMRKILKKQGVTPDYANEIRMTDNYLPLFEMIREAQKGKCAKAEPHIDAVVRDIRERRRFTPRHNVFEGLFSFLSSVFWENRKAMARRDRNFTVDDACNRCGRCRKECPLDNIASGETGKPLWKGRCAFCLACIHRCPAHAIHLTHEKSAARFIHPSGGAGGGWHLSFLRSAAKRAATAEGGKPPVVARPFPE